MRQKDQIEKDKLAQFESKLTVVDLDKWKKARLEELSEICLRHGMKDYAKDVIERDNMDLVRSFVNTDKNAFNEYKISSSIDKVLVKK